MPIATGRYAHCIRFTTTAIAQRWANQHGEANQSMDENAKQEIS
jgi:hypothetical protein